jgi:hypothetical protein
VDQDRDIAALFLNAPNWANWRVIEPNGSIGWFEEEPFPDTMGWFAQTGRVSDRGSHSGAKPCPEWREMKWQRPGADESAYRGLYDWNLAPDDCNYGAIDDDGSAAWYVERPTRGPNGWAPVDGFFQVMNDNARIDVATHFYKSHRRWGFPGWEKTLERRPAAEVPLENAEPDYVPPSAAGSW